MQLLLIAIGVDIAAVKAAVANAIVNYIFCHFYGNICSK